MNPAMVSPAVAASRGRSRSRGARPRWAAPTFRRAAVAAVAAAATPMAKPGAVQQDLEEIEISSHFMQFWKILAELLANIKPRLFN